MVEVRCTTCAVLVRFDETWRRQRQPSSRHSCILISFHVIGLVGEHLFLKVRFHCVDHVIVVVGGGAWWYTCLHQWWLRSLIPHILMLLQLLRVLLLEWHIYAAHLRLALALDLILVLILVVNMMVLLLQWHVKRLSFWTLPIKSHLFIIILARTVLTLFHSSL